MQGWFWTGVMSILLLVGMHVSLEREADAATGDFNCEAMLTMDSDVQRGATKLMAFGFAQGMVYGYDNMGQELVFLLPPPSLNSFSSYIISVCQNDPSLTLGAAIEAAADDLIVTQ